MPIISIHFSGKKITRKLELLYESGKEFSLEELGSSLKTVSFLHITPNELSLILQELSNSIVCDEIIIYFKNSLLRNKEIAYESSYILHSRWLDYSLDDIKNMNLAYESQIKEIISKFEFENNHPVIRLKLED